MRVIWLRVSQDKYELPEVVADSAQELAYKCGTSVNTIRSTMSHYNRGLLKWRKYIRIEVEEESDGINK